MSVVLFDIPVFVVSISPGRYKNAYLWRRKFMPTPRIFPCLRLVTFVLLSFNIRVAWSDEMFGFVSTDIYPLLCSIIKYMPNKLLFSNLKTSSLIFINLILSLFSAIIRSFHIHDFRYFVRNTNLQFSTCKLNKKSSFMKLKTTYRETQKFP